MASQKVPEAGSGTIGSEAGLGATAQEGRSGKAAGVAGDGKQVQAGRSGKAAGVAGDGKKVQAGRSGKAAGVAGDEKQVQAGRLGKAARKLQVQAAKEDYRHYKDKTDDHDDYKSRRGTPKVNLLMK